MPRTPLPTSLHFIWTCLPTIRPLETATSSWRLQVMPSPMDTPPIQCSFNRQVSYALHSSPSRVFVGTN